MTGSQRSPHHVGGRDWDRLPERGSARLVGLMIWLSLRLGWHVGYLLLYPITLYFFLWSRGARRNSRIYLARALGRAATFRDIYRQYFAFAAVILDRVYIFADRIGGYDVRLVGLDHLTDRLAEGRGCLLLGAHVGSFEILRAVAPRDGRLTVKALMHRGGATPLTGPLERLNPALCDDIIAIGAPDTMLKVRESLSAGAIVGVLGDRAPDAASHHRAGKRVAVDFFGHPAEFPTGPMQMAAALNVPVVVFFGVWVGPRRYEVRFEPFADPVVLGADRPRDLGCWVQRYAARVEACCRAHPYNWFNLYNFWGSRDDAAEGFGAAPVAAAVSVADAGAGGRAVPDRGSDGSAGGGAWQSRDLPGGKACRPVDHAGA